MPARALTLAETAAELGRSADWLQRRWQHLASKQGFPAPVLGAAPPLRWSAAQVYAWLDRDLPPKQRLAAAAFRAALEAATDTAADGAARLGQADAAAEARVLLEQRFVRAPTTATTIP